MQRRVFLAGLGWPAAWTSISVLAAGDPEPGEVPADFRLVAQFGSGESPWKSWKVTVAANGHGTQEVFQSDPPVVHRLALTAADVRLLVDAVRQARFFELPENYEAKVTDLPTLILEVRANGRTHHVRVYAPSEVRKRTGVDRFLHVWDLILRKVPSPNPDQRPGMYR